MKRKREGTCAVSPLPASPCPGRARGRPYPATSMRGASVGPHRELGQNITWQAERAEQRESEKQLCEKYTSFHKWRGTGACFFPWVSGAAHKMRAAHGHSQKGGFSKALFQGQAYLTSAERVWSRLNQREREVAETDHGKVIIHFNGVQLEVPRGASLKTH